ncbi:MAG TPA: C69 family dipeptidase [Candidatus Kapabacteria bacterium]|nr:C69 family dipeptidase [Candidatus Kapabacteria bacterium]
MSNKKSVRMENSSCTTMIVGKNATVDGSVIVAHSDDDVADERVIFVPGGKQTKGAKRNVYYDNCSLEPNTDYNSTNIRRYIGEDRGPGYNTKDYPNSNSLGEITLDFLGKILDNPPKETYSYFDGNYGIMNEHGLMIGECTCGAKIHPDPEKNKRIFYSAELSRVALETCKTAFDAVKVIAYLIKEYGYYGTGETLLLGDAGEAWVMEMCGYILKNDKEIEKKAGLWVAQRVPDDHFFVAANQFRIRDIYQDKEDKKKLNPTELYFESIEPENHKTSIVSKKNTDKIYYSANLFTVCEAMGWKEDKASRQLDWVSTVSNGEYGHPYYSLRRVWRAFSKVNPSLHLSPKVQNGYTRQYPFSIPLPTDPTMPGSTEPVKKLSILDIAAVYRDHYEGTEFDLTVGTAAGPFGNPVRYDINADQGDTFNLNTYTPQGAWERSICIYRCGTLWLNQAKKVNDEVVGISWIGLDRPSANCLMPFYCKMNLPESIQTMNLLEFAFDHTPANEPIKTSAWWAFNFVANYINLNYSYMMVELKALQSKLEVDAFTKINDVLSTGNMNDLIAFCNDHSQKVIRAWWKLATQLIVKYNDGYLTTGPNNTMEKIDYPKNWLKVAGYFDGPTKY